MESNEEENKNTNVLANIFYFLHETVVAADKPISMLVGVLLPFIAPLLPALITSKSLKEFMKFEDSWTWIAVASFELIGYLGMIAAVGAAMRLAKNKDAESVESLTWNRNFYLTAYVIYLITLISSNTILEIVNGVSLSHVLVILCLTVGLSISAGILNASRLYERDEKNEEEKIRQEKREDKLKTKLINKGMNPLVLYNSNIGQPVAIDETVQKIEKTKYASDYKDKVLQMLEEVWESESRVLKPSEITERVNKKYRTNFSNTKAKGFWSQTTSDWKLKKGI